MGKIIVVGELHQDLYYKTSFLSDLSDALASELWKMLESNPPQDRSSLQDAINTILGDFPKKIPGESHSVRGGNGNNSAELLAIFDLPVQLLTVVGRGAEWMRPQLEELGIDPATVFQKDAPTPISTILEDPKFTKIFVAPNLKAEMNFEGISLPDEIFSGADIIFVTPLDFKYTDLLRQAIRGGDGMIIAVTLETQKIADLPTLITCMPGVVDIMFANLDDCAHVAGVSWQADNEWEYVQLVDDYFQQFSFTRVYTWGKRGTYLCSTNGIFAHVPSYDVTVINRTGAGDTFAAGFIAKLHEFLQEGYDPRYLADSGLERFWNQCVEFGAAAAAFRISHNYAPTKAELEVFHTEMGSLID
jgi:sugar/nucleoside kinase (ribokinase family)